jgi:hypothetical protein
VCHSNGRNVGQCLLVADFVAEIGDQTSEAADAIF